MQASSRSTQGNGWRGVVVRGSVGALVGGAAYGASRMIGGSRPQTPRMLSAAFRELRPDHSGSRRLLPKNLDAKKLVPKGLDARKLVDSLDLGDLIRKVGDTAEQLESRSEDVRMISGQAKRLSRKLS